MAIQYRYAGRRSRRTGSRRRARRQSAFHSGGRIRPRRNGTYSRRQTWCSFTRASNRHRFVQGAQSWSEAASAEARQRANETPGQARFGKRPKNRPQKNFTHAFPCHERCAQTRKSSVSIEKSALTTSKAGGGSTLSAFTFGRSKKGCAHEKTSPLTWRCDLDGGGGARLANWRDPSRREFVYTQRKETSATSTSRATTWP